MASFVPMRVLRRVDLPTFGAPTIVIKPERNGGVLIVLDHRQKDQSSPPISGGGVVGRSPSTAYGTWLPLGCLDIMRLTAFTQVTDWRQSALAAFVP